jgi:diadenosine tetraphosphatase ApaH/serine/threonine PP2A family protein phosphatase
MLEIFHICGLPPYTKYLFLGDYVDRGSKSVEVIMLLCALKIRFRDSFFLLRGNHESKNVTQIYGFKQEVLIKYRCELLYDAFEPLFNSIPIASVVNHSIFCVHGGISRCAMTLGEIGRINRFVEIPVTGALCDLVWADPANDENWFTESGRNAGCKFGGRATADFLKRNDIKLIVRAHQMMSEGYEYCQDNRVLTVFSAPNYEGVVGNKAGILVVDERNGCNLIKFKAVPSKETLMDVLGTFVY